MRAVDVAVVGAGVHGAAAAFHLARQGATALVVERGTPASGPTGLSSAVCRSYYTDPFLARMARDSIRMMEGFEELTGRPSGFRRTGAMFLHPEEDLDQVRASAGVLNELGIPVDVLDPAEIARRFPAFALDGIAVGAWEREAGYADPVAVTEGLIDGAKRDGAVVRSRTPGHRAGEPFRRRRDPDPGRR